MPGLPAITTGSLPPVLKLSLPQSLLWYLSVFPCWPSSKLLSHVFRFRISVQQGQGFLSVLFTDPSWVSSLVYNCLFRKDLFIRFKGRPTEGNIDRKGKRKRNLRWFGLLRKWLHWPGLGQNEARNLEHHFNFSHEWQRPKYLGYLRWTDLGRQIRNDIARTWTKAYTGCWHHRWQLNLLCHQASLCAFLLNGCEWNLWAVKKSAY